MGLIRAPAALETFARVCSDAFPVITPGALRPTGRQLGLDVLEGAAGIGRVVRGDVAQIVRGAHAVIAVAR